MILGKCLRAKIVLLQSIINATAWDSWPQISVVIDAQHFCFLVLGQNAAYVQKREASFANLIIKTGFITHASSSLPKFTLTTRCTLTRSWIPKLGYRTLNSTPNVMALNAQYAQTKARWSPAWLVTTETAPGISMFNVGSKWISSKTKSKSRWSSTTLKTQRNLPFFAPPMKNLRSMPLDQRLLTIISYLGSSKTSKNSSVW